MSKHRTKRVYIAGPMRGYDDFNYPAFNEASERIRQKGWAPINPAELDGIFKVDNPLNPSGNGVNREIASRDLNAILDCDAIAVLEGWEYSKGASAEFLVARWLGLQLLDAKTLEPLNFDFTQLTINLDDYNCECRTQRKPNDLHAVGSFTAMYDNPIPEAEPLGKVESCQMKPFDRKGNCGCRWLSSNNGDECPIHGKVGIRGWNTPTRDLDSDWDWEEPIWLKEHLNNKSSLVSCSGSNSIVPTDKGKKVEAEIKKKDTNPKDAIGCQKVPESTVPGPVVMELGLALLEGALKYGRHNYRVIGVRYSVYYDAAMRHLKAWWEGEDDDPDSGLHHVTKAIATLTVLRDAMLQDKVKDDRPPKSPDGWLNNLNNKVKDLLERYPNPVPPYTGKQHGSSKEI